MGNILDTTTNPKKNNINNTVKTDSKKNINNTVKTDSKKNINNTVKTDPKKNINNTVKTDPNKNINNTIKTYPNKNIKRNNEIRLIKKSINISNKFINYKIEGGSGFESVKVMLKHNQEIIANGGTMNYMSSGIINSTKALNNGNSIFNSLQKIVGRAVSGSSIFYNVYKNNTNNNNEFVSLSSNAPGNIGTFIIPKGRELNIVSDNYICSTNNLDISGTAQFGGILLGYGLFFINVKLKNENNDEKGILWISSYGDLIEYELKPYEKIIVDNGVFVAFDSEITIETYVIESTNTLSTAKTFLFSGEGLISQMTNPTELTKSIFLQSRSRIFYNDYIKNICEKK